LTEWFRVAGSWPVVRRALWYAIGVGALLIAINHGDAILRGELSPERLLRMALTVSVPYVVSTASSVAALRDSGRVSSAAGIDPSLGRPVR
jgi:hypothetical protein